ncbi:hypothetical protein NUW54_g1254 [Trametes sanguinea]|uniref:Uncharacterized protein n=1 Tax=Trametes sanguinea TaxID=158606 RepID=A0ACC1Q8S0_9APHY|nr:hypothetical protein NUW54_g1254 [Trametes sanguinea]
MSKSAQRRLQRKSPTDILFRLYNLIRLSPSQLESQITPAPVTTSPDSMRPHKSDAAGERASEAGQPITALPKAVVVSGLEYTTMAAQRALMRVLTERRLIVDAAGDGEDDASTTRDPPDDDDGTWNLPEGFIMVYVCRWDPYEQPAILRGLVRITSL